MSSYAAFTNPDGTETLVEVEATGAVVAPGATIKAGLTDRVRNSIGFAPGNLQEALGAAIRSSAQALHAAVGQLSPAPSDVEITFALKAAGELGVIAIGKVGGESNYTVKLTWKSPTPAPITTGG